MILLTLPSSRSTTQKNISESPAGLNPPWEKCHKCLFQETNQTILFTLRRFISPLTEVDLHADQIHQNQAVLSYLSTVTTEITLPIQDQQTIEVEVVCGVFSSSIKFFASRSVGRGPMCSGPVAKRVNSALIIRLCRVNSRAARWGRGSLQNHDLT